MLIRILHAADSGTAWHDSSPTPPVDQVTGNTED